MDSGNSSYANWLILPGFLQVCSGICVCDEPMPSLHRSGALDRIEWCTMVVLNSVILTLERRP